MNTRKKQPAVYILASKPNGALYTGVTSNLVRRVWEHKTSAVKGFTKRYGIYRLVYYELHERMENAILQEKQIKAGSRARKLAMIHAMNPTREDLYLKIL